MPFFGLLESCERHQLSTELLTFIIVDVWRSVSFLIQRCPSTMLHTCQCINVLDGLRIIASYSTKPINDNQYVRNTG